MTLKQLEKILGKPNSVSRIATHNEEVGNRIFFNLADPIYTDLHCAIWNCGVRPDDSAVERIGKRCVACEKSEGAWAVAAACTVHAPCFMK